MPRKIDSLYAWIATGPNGDEFVVGAAIPELGGMVPLVGANRARIESLRSYAELTRKTCGYPVRLVRFLARADLEVLP
jgi:hypothetical protein